MRYRIACKTRYQPVRYDASWRGLAPPGLYQLLMAHHPGNAGLDALTTGAHEGVLAMVDDVVKRVRVEAASMGIEQHPVASTYIDGGFVLPTSQKGEVYRSAFPELAGILVNAISDIGSLGIPLEIVDAWRGEFEDHLHPLQLRDRMKRAGIALTASQISD